MAINDSRSIETLIAEGAYDQAAQRALDSGNPTLAADLFEKIWDFASASDAARISGDLERALRCAIESNDGGRTEGLLRDFADAQDGHKRAAEILASRRSFELAAHQAQLAGEMEQAAHYYLEANQELEAAGLLFELGDDQSSGKILEAFLQFASDELEIARAHLLLGKILSHCAQHEAAVRHLQRAIRVDSLRIDAQKQLLLELLSLGFRDAARDVLISLRKLSPDIPATLDEALKTLRQAQRSGKRDEDPLIGGRYRTEKLLGAGSSGRVFEGFDETSKRPVAIKILAGSLQNGTEAYERFIRETQITSTLHHPNIVEVHDVSGTQGFIVMELMTGNLAERGLPLSETQVRRLAHDILSALEKSHQLGVIHRDIKPANIFFDTRGIAKLGDFGVAHLLDLGETQTGGLIGTLAYMAPEQITGSKLSVAADYYSLGVTLFEALTGAPPFKGPDFIAQHLGEIAPSPSSVAEVASEWDLLFERLLAKAPEERLSSVEEARALLDQTDQHAAGLVLPQKRIAARSPRKSRDILAARPEENEATNAERYRFESIFFQTSNSTLSRAMDTYLDRSVIIERFAETLTEEREKRLWLLARGGGPFVQRVLSYDRKHAIVVFEAPSGHSLAELETPVDRRYCLRLLKRISRALYPLHNSDKAHGGIGLRTILIDARGNPTVMVSGIPKLQHLPPMATDVHSTIEALLFTRNLSGGGVAALVADMVPDVATQETLLDMPLQSAMDLYSFAEALEKAFLKGSQMAEK